MGGGPGEKGAAQPRPAQRRKLPKSQRSLVCVLQALEGSEAVVELRNDVTLRGTVASVDDSMNVELEGGVTVETPGGRVSKVETAHVQGSSVRFVHMPDVPPAELVAAHRAKLDAARDHYRAQHVFGQKHAPGTDTALAARSMQPSDKGGG